VANFDFPRTRKAFNQLCGTRHPAQAMREAFDRETLVKGTTSTYTTTTPAKDYDLSVDVLANVPYKISMVLYVTTASGGIKLDQAGGTAVASSYKGKTTFTNVNSTLPIYVDVAALNTAQASIANAVVRVEHEAVGIFSNSGTLVVQLAQFAASGTTVVGVGSYISAEPLTALYAK
jgi:hypothetical protein